MHIGEPTVDAVVPPRQLRVVDAKQAEHRGVDVIDLRRVFAIERLANLADEANRRLQTLGIRNVSLKSADGTFGWDTYMPFDVILVAAGGPEVPKPLVAQLKIGGKLVIPIGDDQRSQILIRVTRTESGYSQENFGPCAFVPLIGEHGW